MRWIARRAVPTGRAVSAGASSGTCALRGCDPKNMLIASAETVDSVGRMRGRGVAGDVRIDWPELIAFKRTFTDPIPQKREHDYAERGIDTFHGHARVTDRNTMGVDGTALEGRHFLIAAGAEPIKLGIPGAEYLVTHEDFLAVESLPPRIVLVGGGYIAAEFAHIAARAGAQVTIVQRDERMLKHFDPDLLGWLMEKFRAIGVDVHTRTTVEAIEKTRPVHGPSLLKPPSQPCPRRVHGAGAVVLARRRGCGCRHSPRARSAAGFARP